MRKPLLIMMTFLSFVTLTKAQNRTWFYDFGTGTTNSFSTSGQVYTGPAFTPATQTNGGAVTVRVGSQGGSVTLSNTSGNASLIIVSPTGASANKLAFSEYTASKLATTKFKIGFGTATSGYFNFIQGKITTSPTSYTSGSTVQNADTFSGLRFISNADGATINVAYRSASAWTLFPSVVNLDQGQTYEIEVYLNNSNASVNYTRDGAQTIASGKADLWITPIAANGTRGVTVKRADDYGGGGLPLDSDMDSFAFYGEGSLGNAAVTTLDDIVYANHIPPSTLPVSLTSFTGKANRQTVDLNWKTSSEQNNAYFEILRSTDGKSFSKIGEVKGNGTSQVEHNYNFSDVQPLPGVNYYQLKQFDNNGDFKLYDPIPVKSNVTASTLSIFVNKSNQTFDVNIKSAINGNASFKIYDLNGRKVIDQSLNLEKGNINLSLPSNASAAGVHIATLTIGNEKITTKFVK